MRPKNSKRRLIILGCTGSIGTTALQALDSMRDAFTIVGLSAHSSLDSLVAIAEQWSCPNVCLSTDAYSETIPEKVRFRGHEGLLRMIQETEADMVLNGIAGSSGLASTFAAIESGKDVALSNKESIVMAGKILFSYAERHHVRIIPVDSEHSTLYSLINAYGRDSVHSLVITASGGPFRTLPMQQMQDITVEQALAHPTWKMGAKISIDSSTLANKGLEVIEAHYLFSFPPERIEVVVHPQSVVHSLIRLESGAVYAQLTPPDMTLPIMAALAEKYVPLREIVRPLDFSELTLEFQAPDFTRFPLLVSAFTTIQYGGGYPIAFNAANEVAVSHFMRRSLNYRNIAELVSRCLDHDWSASYENLEEVVSLDQEARVRAEAIAREFTR